MNDGDDLDDLIAAARQLDPQAWTARDRLWQERGVNPDRMDQVPRNGTERRMRDRRMQSIAVAADWYLDPAGILSFEEAKVGRAELDRAIAGDVLDPAVIARLSEFLTTG